jgi:hypothetical protein
VPLQQNSLPSGEEPLTAVTKRKKGWGKSSLLLCDAVMCGVEDPCAFFFRVRIMLSKKMKVYVRFFEGTTHCCQKFTFLEGRGISVTFGLLAMDIKNAQMYEIYCAVELIHICSQNSPWCLRVLQSLHECYFCSLKF